MNTGLQIAGASFALMLASVGAHAGPCTDQINDLQKMMSSSDAGSGPTMRTGSSGDLTTGSTQPPSGSSGDVAVSATPRQVPQAGEAPKTNATTAMNAATQDKATSPQDVRSQIQGQPTTSQIASGAMPAPDRMKQLDAALGRARAADQSGNASECASAISEAKGLLGTR